MAPLQITEKKHKQQQIHPYAKAMFAILFK